MCSGTVSFHSELHRSFLGVPLLLASVTPILVSVVTCGNMSSLMGSASLIHHVDLTRRSVLEAEV